MLPFLVTVAAAATSPPNLNSNSHPPNNPNFYKPRARKPAAATAIAFHSPNQIFPLLRQCESRARLAQIHAAVLKTGLDRDPLLLFKILRRCAALESFDYAAQIFARIEDPDVYHYTALIGANLGAGANTDAIRLYSSMVGDSVEPDPVVISYALKACVLELELGVGKQVHGQVIKLEFGSERHVRMKLMELYAKCSEFGDARLVFGGIPERDAVAATILISCYADRGLIGEAREVFDRTADKDTVCWTAMIDRCVRNGRTSESLELFRAMQRENVRPNEFTVVCVLSVCSQIGALELGRWVRSYRKLEDLNDALRKEGYAPARDVVLQDIDEEEKEQALAIHSERLAICYGLISTKPGSTIRIMKNLRVCSDCHSMIKLTSKVTGRKIVVRDRTRFHHFEGGSCSSRMAALARFSSCS